MKIHLVVNADTYNGEPIEDHVLGVYARRDEAEAKLAAIHASFDADEYKSEGWDREVFRLAREWVLGTGVLGVTLTVGEFPDLWRAANAITTCGKLVSEPEARLGAGDVAEAVTTIAAVFKVPTPVPAWPARIVVWEAPDGDKDDYRIIELEVV